jgi:FixJ family two-component response regulator
LLQSTPRASGATSALIISPPVEEDVGATEKVRESARRPNLELAEASSIALNGTAALLLGEGYKKPGGEKVLIVDDVPSFRESVIDIFTDIDISFIEAGSVEEARRILDADREIRIILLDLELSGETGTKILDHIIKRSSDYRVIILTGHDELLPAREAAIYKVFYYLSKSEKGLTKQSLRFAVEQAHQDLERENLTKRNESGKFDDVVLNKYPTPFTYIYQELKSDLGMLETLTRQRDIFKLLLNFSAVALMCEFFNEGARNHELYAKIREESFEPNLQDWFNIINQIIRRKDELRTTFFLDRFSTFFTDANRMHAETLIEVLDRYLGRVTKLSDFEYQEVIQQCDNMLVPLLQDYQFITHFLLCYVYSVQKGRTEYKYRIKECNGANPQLLFSKRDLKFLMNANEMYLINLNNEQFQSLHPFIILEYCTDCRQLEIFFYVKYSNNQMHYLSYKTGHELFTSAYWKEFKDLIRVSP